MVGVSRQAFETKVITAIIREYYREKGAFPDAKQIIERVDPTYRAIFLEHTVQKVSNDVQTMVSALKKGNTNAMYKIQQEYEVAAFGYVEALGNAINKNRIKPHPPREPKKMTGTRTDEEEIAFLKLMLAKAKDLEKVPPSTVADMLQRIRARYTHPQIVALANQIEAAMKIRAKNSISQHRRGKPRPPRRTH